MQLMHKILLTATAMISSTFIAGSAHANMLIEDLSVLEIKNFNGQEWKVDHQEEKSMRIDCTSCNDAIFINIQLRGRDTFGVLGIEKAKKAKSQCLESNDMALQCDTVEGIEIGNVSGIASTLKIIDGIFIASYTLGDEKTLIQIRTKAPTKDAAGEFNQKLFETIKSEVIIQ